MTVKPAHEDLLLWSQNRVEPWKICFCSKSGFDGCMAELWLLTAAAATAEISIIKIGLVYVIMIVMMCRGAREAGPEEQPHIISAM